ncbi:MAG: inner membrane-spanning protein YciB [Paracoccaceae bacterium]|nr:inner membrane-spanning protein YciB [Paracoccaceae bacterium]
MANKTINPLVKTALELGPVIAFFVAYIALKDRVFTINGTEYGGFIVATAALVPLLLISTGLLWKLTGRLSRMQIMTMVLVVIFGGLTVWLNDERFLKIKPTIVYLVFAGLLGAGLLRGRSYLQYVMEEMIPMTEAGWMILTRRLTAFFVALALSNEIVWRFMSTEAWVYFETFVLTAAVFVFFITQGRLFETHAIKTDETGTPDK